MLRKVAGVALVAAALIAAVAAGPRLGPGQPGTAVVGGLPQSPLVGTCLADDVDSLREVSCQAPHVAEVTMAWSAWDPTLTATERNALRAGCRGAARTYLGGVPGPAAKSFAISAASDGWRPLPLILTSDVVSGPTRNDPIGYGACVLRVQPTEGAYATTPTVVGRVADLMPMNRRPDALRSCYVVRDPLPPPIPCRTWHLGEVLAVQVISVGDASDVPVALADAGRLAECAEQAALEIGVADPTFGGRLRVAVDGQVLGAATASSGSGLAIRTTVQLRCLIEVVDGRLTDSVIGLDGRSLPLR